MVTPVAQSAVALSPSEVLRYSRHLIMPEVALDGQRRLKAASVLLVGAGGLGAPLGLYLAAAGVGHLGIVDFDVVEFSNLQRQVIHATPDVGRPKTQSALDRLRAVNPEIVITAHELHLTSANALDVFRPYDIVIDGTDNFPTRYLINDACVLLGKPAIYGSIYRFEGQASVFWPPAGPCYRCLFAQPPPPGLVPSCAEGGVLGVLPGVIGCIQATEALKLILGKGEPLIGRLLLYDALEMRFREVHIRRDPRCPVCGEHPTITHLIDYEQFCGLAPADAPPAADEVTVEELKARLDRGDDLVLLDVRSPEEWQICRIAGARLLPVDELLARMHELDPAREMAVYCKTGLRSARAVSALRQAGFARARSLRGGIVEWGRRVDPTMALY